MSKGTGGQDLKTGRVVRNVDVSARNGNAPGPVGRVDAAHDLGALGIRDVNDLETGMGIPNVGMGA